MLYVIELEIYDFENKIASVMTMRQEIEGSIQQGHVLIIKDEWLRIATVIHDIDHSMSILHLERRSVNTVHFESCVREYLLKGWKVVSRGKKDAIV